MLQCLSITEFTKESKVLPYLTEDRLGDYLNSIFPNNVFVHDKVIPESNIRNRADYYCKELNLVVEFDGYRHFTVPSTILADIRKDVVYENLGIRVVRIPYFIQLDTRTVEFFFGIIGWEPPNCAGLLMYPHGFVDIKAATPAWFCSLGLSFYSKWQKIVIDNNTVFGHDPLTASCNYQIEVLHRQRLEVYPM